MRNRGLTEEQKELRDGRLTASVVGCLMTGDEAEIMKLWETMVGLSEGDDLSNHWPAQLGLSTEELNLDWYEYKRSTRVIRRGEVVQRDDWMAATLDGWDEVAGHPVEAKHVGGFESEEVVLARYQPQLHWTMYVTRASKLGFTVIYGAKEPIVDIIEYDPAYGAILIERAERFMTFVRTLTPPIVMPAVKAPLLPEKHIEMMETKEANFWADQAATWLQHAPSRDKANAAEKELKGMMPADAKKATGAGVVITRDRAGRLSLREEKKE